MNYLKARDEYQELVNAGNAGEPTGIQNLVSQNWW